MGDEVITKNELLPQDELLPIERLLINYNYRLFGAVLVLLEKQKSEAVQTAGVSVYQGRGMLIYNPAFMASMTMEDRLFILMHEASHVILSSMSRSAGRDKTLWNFATDIVINEMLAHNFKLKIPEGLLDMAFLDSITGKKTHSPDGCNGIVNINADDIYKELALFIEHIVRRGNKAIVTLKNGRTEEINIYGEECDEDVSGLDGRVKQMIKDVLNGAEEYGRAAGNFVKGLLKAVKKSFPFKDVLKKQFEKKDYDFSRPNRRIKVCDSFFPRRKTPAFVVYAAVDVSASTTELTEDFLGYIMALPQFEEVVFFDTKIQHVLKKGQPMPIVMNGYGGTDINCVIKRWQKVEDNNRSKKLNFVALTDGYVEEIEEMTKEQILVLTTGIDIDGARNVRIRV